MKDDLLREACAQLAQEEADALEQGMTRTEARQADEAYRHHRRKALALIRRHTRNTKGYSVVFLRVAAVLLVALAGIYLSTRPSPLDNVELHQLPGTTVMPYYTDEPTDTPAPSPVPRTPEPTKEPPSTIAPENEIKETEIPTEIPIITSIPTKTPTLTPRPTLEPTFAPTATPTPSPMPTEAPTLEPTVLPTEAPAPEPTALPTETPSSPPAAMPAFTEAPAEGLVPDSWQGAYFPAYLPPNNQLVSVTREEGCNTASYRRYNQILIFTEYDSIQLIEAAPEAEVSYLDLDGRVVMRARDENGITLIWEQDGHTFTLFTTEDDGLDVAASVEKR